MNLTEPFSLSIILEWDNVRLSEMSRAKAMLNELRNQIHQLKTISRQPSKGLEFLRHFEDPVELFITFNNEEIQEENVRKIVAEVLPAVDEKDMVIHFLGAPGLNYYQLKNFGAQHAKGTLIVLVDSDTIPDEDWLLNLISPFEDAQVAVVGGIQYIDSPASVYSKTVALTWLFPLRAEDKKLVAMDSFWASNVAFRKEIFTRFPFPEHTDMARGGCALLATKLLQNGIPIYRSTGAQLRHPPPNGLRHFVMRGISHGRDRLLIVQRIKDAKPITIWQSFTFLTKNLARSVYRILHYRSKVGLSMIGVPASVVIAGTYYFLYFIGEMITHVSPRFMTNRFRL